MSGLEVFSTIIAAAQTIEYSLQVYGIVKKFTSAVSNELRYKNIIQQLFCTLRQIEENPHLQTPETHGHTKELKDTLDGIGNTLSRYKKSRFLASAAFIVKQKHYDEILNQLDYQRAALSLHITQLSYAALCDQKDVLNSIRAAVQRRPCSQTSSHHPGTSMQACPLQHARTDQIDTPRPLSCVLKEADQTPHQLSLDCLDAEQQEKTEILSQGDRPLERASIDDDPTELRLEDNTMAASGFQVLGIQICKGGSVTDAELMQATSKMNIGHNIHTGQGMQVIGQRVCSGARPRRFAGYYHHNTHQGNGNQLIGLMLE
ncbi:hypothetical protein GGR56DRAFT_613419 [Xylariaceae sp. FL0804]|nr:hypothetical protein GGR56DRAFT_613419 [Xylariaceae sp. FL0804]